MNRVLNVAFCLLTWLAACGGAVPHQARAQPNPQESGAIAACPRERGQSLGESYQTDNYSLLLCQQGKAIYLVGHEKYQYGAFIEARVKERTAEKLVAEDENGFTYQIRQGQLTVTQGGRVMARETLYTPIDLRQLPPDKVLTGSDPKAIALAVFGNREPGEGNFQETVTVTEPQPNLAIVMITQLGLPDDSLRGFRYRLEFLREVTSGKSQWRLVWAGHQHTCQPGRGAQSWTVEPCS